MPTALPGRVSSAAEIAPRASSPPGAPGCVGVDVCFLGYGLPSFLSLPAKSFFCGVSVFNSSATLPSAAVVFFLASSFTWNPRNAPMTIGNCASSPSRKNPMTHAPGCNPQVVPVPLVCALSVGSSTCAQGSTFVGISFVYACFALCPVYQPRIRTWTRPSSEGSLIFSTSPIHQVYPSRPR